MAKSMRAAEYQKPSTEVQMGSSTPTMPTNTQKAETQLAPLKMRRSVSKVMKAAPSKAYVLQSMQPARAK